MLSNLSHQFRCVFVAQRTTKQRTTRKLGRRESDQQEGREIKRISLLGEALRSYHLLHSPESPLNYFVQLLDKRLLLEK